MTNVDSEKKETVMRSLALAGLVAIIFIIAWLSVQIVQVAPSAFSSLASLADGIAQYEETLHEEKELEVLVIAEQTEVISAGEETILSWEPTDANGTYSFSYDCVDGASLSVINEDGIRLIDCDVAYNISDSNSLTVIVDSDNENYTDIAYTVSFSTVDDAEIYSTGSSTLTIVAREQEEEIIEETTEEVTPETEPEETTDGGFAYEFEYKIPESDPSGYTDLRATFLNVGDIVNDRFVARNLEQEGTGAVQFTVKNIGTKTSKEWIFTAELPDGTDYTSANQEPLKPNEQATIVIGFNTLDDNSFTFEVAVDTENDIVSANDGFSRFVLIQE